MKVTDMDTSKQKVETETPPKNDPPKEESPKEEPPKEKVVEKIVEKIVEKEVIKPDPADKTRITELEGAIRKVTGYKLKILIRLRKKLLKKHIRKVKKK